jgi:hypothetical protein
MAQEYFLYTTEFNNTLVDRSNSSFAPLPPNTGEIFINFFIPPNQPLYLYRESGGTIILNDDQTIKDYLNATVPPTEEEEELLAILSGLTGTTGGSAEDRVRWLNIYTGGTYQKNDMVRDGVFTMIANKDTDDVPAPQPVGESRSAFNNDGSAPFVVETEINVQQVIIGQRYTSADDTNGWIREIRFFNPIVNTGVSLDLFVVRNPTGSTSTTTSLGSFTFTRTGWFTLAAGNSILPPKFSFDILGVLRNRGGQSSSTVNGEWSYKRSNNNPSNGEITHSNSSKVLNISFEDKNSNDLSATLSTLQVGDEIQASNITWVIDEVLNITGSRIEVEVTPTTRISENDYNFTFTLFSTTTIPFPEIADFYSGGTVQGFQGIDNDYSSGFITLDENSYGFDVLFQPAESSPDWDFVATFGDGGGGSAGVTYWGDIQGDINNQQDLQNQFSEVNADIAVVSAATLNKIDRVTGATGNVGVFLANGNLQDSGFPISGLTGGTGSAENPLYAFSRTEANGTVLSSFNVTLNKAGTGIYDYTFDSPALDGNYAIFAQPLETTTDTNTQISNITASGFRVSVGVGDNGATPDVLTDTDHSVAIFGVPVSGSTQIPVVSVEQFTGYTATTQIEIDNKIDKVTGTTGNVGTFTVDGNLEDSGFAIADLTGGTGSADGVVSGATLNGSALELSRTEGLPDVTVDLAPITGDSLSINDFNAYSAATDTRIESLEDSLSQLPTGLSAVQIRRTTAFALPPTWGDITFDTKDTENDPDVVSGDSVNTDNIIIGQDGLYFIQYDGVVDAGGQLRVRVNDATVLNGTTKNVFSNVTGIAATTRLLDISNGVVLQLTSGDFITLQGQQNATVGASNLVSDATLKVFKLDSAKGSKGDKGDTGAGSTIFVENDGVNANPTGGTYSRLNFQDGITAVDAGDGQTINISASTTSNPTSNIIQLVDGAGAQPTNAVTPATITWNTQEIIDNTVFSEAAGVITVLQDGFYRLSYNLRTNSTDSNRGNQGASIRLNGSGFILPTTTASYKRNTSNNETSNSLSQYIVQLSANDTLELQAYQLGDAANLQTVAGESFINIEYLG